VAGLEWYPCGRLKLCFSLLQGYHPNPATPKLQHTSNQEHTTKNVPLSLPIEVCESKKKLHFVVQCNSLCHGRAYVR